jgi:hypothetical protein
MSIKSPLIKSEKPVLSQVEQRLHKGIKAGGSRGLTAGWLTQGTCARFFRTGCVLFMMKRPPSSAHLAPQDDGTHSQYI